MRSIWLFLRPLVIVGGGVIIGGSIVESYIHGVSIYDAIFIESWKN